MTRVRKQLERLEERAMLSASYSAMPQGPASYGFVQRGGGPYGGGEPRGGETAMFASQPQHQSGYQTQGMWSEPGAGLEFGGFHDRPSGFGTIGPVSHMSRFDAGPPYYASSFSHYGGGYSGYDPSYTNDVSWQQFPSNPMPPPLASTAPPVTANTPPITATSPPQTTSSPPPTIVYVVRYATAPPTFVDDFYDWSSGQSSQSPGRWTSSIDSTPLFAEKPSGGSRSPFISIDTATIVSGLGSLPLPTIVTGIPTAAQIVRAQTNAVPLLSVEARDVALQAYTSSLLLLSPAGSNEYLNLKSAAADTHAYGEAVDDFIRLTDAAVPDESVIPIDVVERERAAVDAVLRDLDDLNTLPAQPLNDSDSLSVNANVLDPLSLNGQGDELMAGDAEGGMVLLQAGGDANESEIILAGAYDSNLDALPMHAGMEASVGYFQAVDVVVEEVPAANVSTSNNSTGATLQPNETDGSASTEGKLDPSRKAAAIVGATTFVGALLWSGRSLPRQADLSAVVEKSRRSVVAS